MHVDTSVVDAFLGSGALPDSWLVRAAAGDDAPPVPAVAPAPGTRADLVAVRTEVLAVLDPFRPAHPGAWDAVLGGWSEVLGSSPAARVALVVGWPEPYDAGVRTDPAGGSVIVVDVARAAAYGPAGRVGVVRTLLDHELAHLALAHLWPPPGDGASYRERLDHVTFDEGVAHYLGMRGHPVLDPAHPAAAARRDEAHRALRAAAAEQDPARQRVLLDRAGAADGFWDKFAAVAGMLACADAEAAAGPAGLAALTAAGWRGFGGRLLDARPTT